MRTHAPIPEEAEQAARALLDAAIEVHRHLGPGFLERIYEEALCHELTLHEAQLLSYLKATDLRLGFIINFKGRLLKDGIKRIVL